VENVNDLADLVFTALRQVQESGEINPILRARLIRWFRNRGVVQRRIAEAYGYHEATVSSWCRLLDLPDEQQRQIEEEEISVSSGRSLSRIADHPELCSQLAREYKEGKIATDDLEGQLCQHRKIGDAPKTPRKRTPRWPDRRARHSKA
jgi:hypothetical protein